MLCGGLPLSSYRGKDVQSDREAAHLLCPVYLKEDRWDNLGSHVFQLKISLATGNWIGSRGFNPHQNLENAATCFLKQWNLERNKWS